MKGKFHLHFHNRSSYQRHCTWSWHDSILANILMVGSRESTQRSFPERVGQHLWTPAGRGRFSGPGLPPAVSLTALLLQCDCQSSEATCLQEASSKEAGHPWGQRPSSLLWKMRQIQVHWLLGGGQARQNKPGTEAKEFGKSQRVKACLHILCQLC